jgi:sugar phosphate isomerase/epimerase
MMPYTLPDSPESNLSLIKAVGREHFAVHLDPVNIVNSPHRYYNNGALIRDCFKMLGPHIKSCHAKDIFLDDKLTTHLDEVRPGLGHLDYGTFLQEIDKLDSDMPLMIEHLKGAEEYARAAEHIRSIASQTGIHL